MSERDENETQREDPREDERDAPKEVTAREVPSARRARPATSSREEVEGEEGEDPEEPSDAATTSGHDDERGSSRPGRAPGTQEATRGEPPTEGDARSSARPPESAPPESSDEEAEAERERRQRSRLEGLLRDSFKRAIERGLDAGLGALESSVDVFEKSKDTIHSGRTAFRGVVDEAKVPRELAHYFFNQIDETKNVLIRAVAREVRDFLDATDVAHELQRALTSLSFEIKTEIRFIPNDKGVVRPEVKAQAAPRMHREDKEKEAPPREEHAEPRRRWGRSRRAEETEDEEA